MKRKEIVRLENEVRENALLPLRRVLRKHGIKPDNISYSYIALHDRALIFAEQSVRDVERIVAGMKRVMPRKGRSNKRAA